MSSPNPYIPIRAQNPCPPNTPLEPPISRQYNSKTAPLAPKTKEPSRAINQPNPTHRTPPRRSPRSVDDPDPNLPSPQPHPHPTPGSHRVRPIQTNSPCDRAHQYRSPIHDPLESTNPIPRRPTQHRHRRPVGHRRAPKANRLSARNRAKSNRFSQQAIFNINTNILKIAAVVPVHHATNPLCSSSIPNRIPKHRVHTQEPKSGS